MLNDQVLAAQGNLQDLAKKVIEVRPDFDEKNKIEYKHKETSADKT